MKLFLTKQTILKRRFISGLLIVFVFLAAIKYTVHAKTTPYNIITTFPLHSCPADVVLNLSGSHAYVVTHLGRELTKIDLVNGSIVTIAHNFNGNPFSLAITEDETTAYVVGDDEDIFWEVDVSTGNVTVEYNGFERPTGIVLNRNETIAYVIDNEQNTLTAVTLNPGLQPAASVSVITNQLINPVGICLSRDYAVAYIAQGSKYVAGGSLVRVDLNNPSQTPQVIVSHMSFDLDDAVGIYITKDGKLAYITEFCGQSMRGDDETDEHVLTSWICIIDLVTGNINRLKATFNLFDCPHDLSLNYTEDSIYVVDTGGAKLVKLNKQDYLADVPPIDSDDDGVPDQWDECPDTPTDSAIYSNGCPSIKGDFDSNGMIGLGDSIGILQTITGIRSE